MALPIGMSLLVFGSLQLCAAVQGVPEEWQQFQQVLTPDIFGSLLNTESRATPLPAGSPEARVISLIIKTIDEKIMSMFKAGFNENAALLDKLWKIMVNASTWAEKNEALAGKYQEQLNTCQKEANDMFDDLQKCNQSESELKTMMDTNCASIVPTATFKIKAPYNEMLKCNMKVSKADVGGKEEVCNAYVHNIKTDAKAFYAAAATSFANAKKWCAANTTAYHSKVVECKRKASEKSTQEAKCAVMEAQRDSAVCLLGGAEEERCSAVVQLGTEAAAVNVEEAKRQQQFADASVARCLLASHMDHKEDRCFAEPARVRCQSLVPGDYNKTIGAMDYHDEARAKNTCVQRSITLSKVTYQKMDSGAYSVGGPKILDVSAQGVLTPSTCKLE